jgi:hypothetical protein
MPDRITITLLTLVFLWGCKSEPEIPDGQIPFDREQWKVKKGPSYIYRDQMVDAVLYSDTLRTLKREKLLERLGEPDREEKGHLYYTIVENRLGFWTLNQKSIVIKFRADDSVEWIKLHE